jgi:hypothetical protein
MKLPIYWVIRYARPRETRTARVGTSSTPLPHNEQKPSSAQSASGRTNDDSLNDIWKDPMVQESLKDGRTPDDIRVMDCPKCGKYGYWNEGSHFSCRFCNKTWIVSSEKADDSITLADTVTVTTEGYDNETLASS